MSKLTLYFLTSRQVPTTLNEKKREIQSKTRRRFSNISYYVPYIFISDSSDELICSSFSESGWEAIVVSAWWCAWSWSWTWLVWSWSELLMPPKARAELTDALYCSSCVGEFENRIPAEIFTFYYHEMDFIMVVVITETTETSSSKSEVFSPACEANNTRQITYCAV